jgi:hypothetical protein
MSAVGFIDHREDVREFQVPVEEPIGGRFLPHRHQSISIHQPRAVTQLVEGLERLAPLIASDLLCGEGRAPGVGHELVASDS